MDKKALYNLSYGVFMLASRAGTKNSGCITNTCMQVANSPVRLAISCMNGNYTCDIIKESGYFTLSVLDENCSFATICHFGYQSGRNVNKFEDAKFLVDMHRIPYLIDETCAVISCRVRQAIDLRTHTMFIAEVTDARILNSNKPLTYAYYQANIKPDKNQMVSAIIENNRKRKIVGWKCKICGYEYRGADLPLEFECPICGHPLEDFEPVYCDICNGFIN